jgi:polyhydroxyalkanoate synthesis regulator phasin
MSDTDKILQAITAIKNELTDFKTETNKRLDTITKDMGEMKQTQNKVSTIIDTLSTKGDVEASEKRLRGEIKASEERMTNEIEVSRADAKTDSLRIQGKLDKQTDRIEDLEKATGTPNRHKN